ncbi:MAG: hypothetical protein NTY45_07820 [Elusimicrobia bacterium]|nr:hypothetical protein [Elusimicrobiota bacterium]
MLKKIFPVLGLVLFQINYCFAAPRPALEAAGRMGEAAAGSVPVPATAPARAGRDLTEDYTRLLRAPDQGLGEVEKAELRKYKVLLVRGFLTGAYVEPFELFGRKINVGRYFKDQMAALDELGVEYALADIDSVMLPGHNAAKLAGEIRNCEKPVIIISHSDGGMYALQALVENPGLAARVRGFIPLQAPFNGTPVAVFVSGNRLLSAAMSKLLGHFGGTMAALESLKPDERGGYQRENSAAIAALVSRLNVLSFASWKAERHNRFDTLLEFSRDLMLRSGLDNDGLVPADSAVLAGSDYIKVEGVDHVVTVMSADSILKFDRRAFTRALLAMTISR